MSDLVEKLYIENTYLKEFKARVVDVKVLNGKIGLALDKTAFYPTSGGQMHDVGTIEGCHVIDVVQEQGQIWHIVDKKILSKNITGKIDWKRRFDFMQQHTAFHLLAQSFLRCGNIETLSSHLGEEFSTIDVNQQEFSLNILTNVEMLANEVICENRAVTSFFISKNQLADFPNIRKIQNNFNRIRLVNIADFDLDPCGGTHVSSTGQIGSIKILGYEKIRGKLRYSFVAGKRSIREFNLYQDYLNKTASKLTTGFADIPVAISKLMNENKRSRKAITQIEEELLDLLVNNILANIKTNKRQLREIPNKSMGFLRKTASKIIKKQECTIALISVSEQINLVMASSMGDNLRQLLEHLLPLIDGRGGGNQTFVQAGGKNVSGILEIKRAIKNQFAEFDN